MATTCVFGISSASASTVLSENWETGMLDGWTAVDTSFDDGQTANDPHWQVLNNPQNISVASPGINPDLVTLPDSGSLPAAYDGTHAVWFGDTTSGTFCGADWNTYTSTPNTTASKNGCTSREPFSGTLTSPPVDLSNAQSATLHFFAWWEIEAVDANTFDLMQVEYSSDGGSTWTTAQLNPVSNPAGKDDQSYSNNGLEVSPSWHEYLVDLTPAAGHSNVLIRFEFKTNDALFNGYRGWLIDDISVNNPADTGTPSIASVQACSGGNAAPVTTVNGSNFIEGSQLLVDGSPVSASFESSQRIETPALSPGTHTLQVQSPDGTLSNKVQVNIGSCAFTVTGISPSSGPTAGGTTVTITGSNFTGATGVTFGPNPATSFNVITDSQLTAVSPHGTGTVDVTVTGPGGASLTSPADQFTYINPPPPGPPAGVSTGAPTVTSSTAAAFTGSVIPEGLLTTAHFEYGLDPTYLGSIGPVVYASTPDQTVGSDFSSHVISAPVAGLVPNALYHVRLVATNSAGTTFGPDVTFMTPHGPVPGAPAIGKTFNASVVSGVVFVLEPGHSAGDRAHATFQKGVGFVPLTEATQLPVGSELDTRLGTVQLNTASAKRGKTENGTFNGGLFKVVQDRSGLTKGLTTLSLLEGAFAGAPSYSSCKATATDVSSPSAKAALSTSVLQTLRGSAHGHFRTKGRYGSATVRGTAWTMSDRCDGTLVTVQRDTVSVQDFVRHVTVIVRAGHRYLAKAPGRRRG